MLAEDMYRFRGYLQDHGIIFCYGGYMTEEVLSGIGNAIKKKLELEQADRNVAKSLFSVFVEQVQNVIRYSAEQVVPDSPQPDADLRYGVLTVGRRDDGYFVACGNLISRRDRERLSAGLARIKGLDKDGLKALYKETLKGEVPEGSKGAGVGFIEMARRATRGFDYDFHDIDAERSFFTVMAHL